jgi:hypothetical protein
VKYFGRNQAVEKVAARQGRQVRKGLCFQTDFESPTQTGRGRSVVTTQPFHSSWAAMASIYTGAESIGDASSPVDDALVKPAGENSAESSAGAARNTLLRRGVAATIFR